MKTISFQHPHARVPTQPQPLKTYSGTPVSYQRHLLSTLVARGPDDREKQYSVVEHFVF